MAIKLSDKDHDVLDEFLNVILDEHKAGNLTLLEARSAIVEAVVLAANGNANVVAYMRATIESKGKD